jgi:hypothetical protein
MTFPYTAYPPEGHLDNLEKGLSLQLTMQYFFLEKKRLPPGLKNLFAG